MAADYGLILKIIVDALKAQAGITGLLGTSTIGGTASQANSIFYGPQVQRPVVFPCISLRDFGPYAADVAMHDNPMLLCQMMVEVSIFGTSSAIRDIQAEIDAYLEEAEWSGALDTATWAIKDIDTSGGWTNVVVPKELTADGSTTNLEQRSKTYPVVAANKVD